MIEGSIFIGAMIIALTQFVKCLNPKVVGWVTILVAVAIGIVVALVDKNIGIVDITVAQGIMIALAAVGTHSVAREIG